MENIENENTEIVTPEVLNTNNTIIDNKMDSIYTLFKNTMGIYKKIIWKLIGINIIPLLGVGLITISFLIVSSLKLSGMLMPPIVVILSILIVMISVWSKATNLVAIRDSEENIGIRESFRRSKKYIWHYFVISILIGFLIFGGTSLFFIPGIILGVMAGFSLLILVNENDKSIDAIVKSRDYVRGNWWSVFGRIILIGVISVIVSMIPAIGPILSVLFIGPFVSIYMFVMYKNLKEISIKNENVIEKNTKKIFILIILLGIFVILLGVRFIGKIDKSNDHINEYKILERQTQDRDFDKS